MRKDEVKSLSYVRTSRWAHASYGGVGISVEEHAKTLLAKSPLWLSLRVRHVMRKHEEKSLSFVRTSRWTYTSSVGVGISVEKHAKTLLAKSPQRLPNRVRHIMGKVENETLTMMAMPR